MKAKVEALVAAIVKYGDNLGEPIHPFVADEMRKQITTLLLSRARRVRGRTVGYVVVARFADHRGRLRDPVLSSLVKKPSRALEVAMDEGGTTSRLARVVLLPPRRK